MINVESEMKAIFDLLNQRTISDIIADENLDKLRESLFQLASSGRDYNLYLLLKIQSSAGTS